MPKYTWVTIFNSYKSFRDKVNPIVDGNNRKYDDNKWKEIVDKVVSTIFKCYSNDDNYYEECKELFLGNKNANIIAALENDSAILKKMFLLRSLEDYIDSGEIDLFVLIVSNMVVVFNKKFDNQNNNKKILKDFVDRMYIYFKYPLFSDTTKQQSHSTVEARNLKTHINLIKEIYENYNLNKSTVDKFKQFLREKDEELLEDTAEFLKQIINNNGGNVSFNNNMQPKNERIISNIIAIFENIKNNIIIKKEINNISN